MKELILIIIFCCAFRSSATPQDSSNETRLFSTALTKANQALKIELITGREQRRTNAVQKIWRTGELRAFLVDFFRTWPEERFVWEPVRLSSGAFAYKTNGIIRGKRRERIEKFTEAEVSEGRIRNAAARKAVLDCFLNDLACGDEYEQMEISAFVS